MKNSPLSSFRSTINSPKKSILKSHRISEIIEPTHHPKYNFSEFTNFATVIKDAEMQDRRNTCNAFLKNKELEEFTQNFAVKKSALYEIKRDLTFDQLTSLQSLSSIDWKKKPSYKKGIMYINELWSDRHYKSVVNSSDLKPKTDMVIMQKKIKLFSDMLKDIDIAYKKIKKFNPKDQRDILNTYFNEAETKKQLSNSLTQSTNLFPGPSHRINRSNIAFNLNQNFTQNLINYEKSIVSCSLEDLLQKLQIFAKLESSEKSQELKSMFKKVIHEKMETVDIYNEKELQQSRNYKNRMMSHYVQNKHSRIKQSSVVSGLQAMHSSPKKKINQDNDNKNKLSFEAIISENNRVSGNLNLNTFDQNNLCKSIGFRRNLSKKSTRKIDNKTDKNEIRLLRQNSEENDNDDEEEYNIYQRSGSTNYIVF